MKRCMYWSSIPCRAFWHGSDRRVEEALDYAAPSFMRFCGHGRERCLERAAAPLTTRQDGCQNTNKRRSQPQRSTFGCGTSRLRLQRGRVRHFCHQPQVRPESRQLYLTYQGHQHFSPLNHLHQESLQPWLTQHQPRQRSKSARTRPLPSANAPQHRPPPHPQTPTQQTTKPAPALSAASARACRPPPQHPLKTPPPATSANRPNSAPTATHP